MSEPTLADEFPKLLDLALAEVRATTRELVRAALSYRDATPPALRRILDEAPEPSFERPA